jgi:hypothetical protein
VNHVWILMERSILHLLLWCSVLFFTRGAGSGRGSI